jgi:hypothetical protein
MILSRVCGDYIRRVLDWHLRLLDHSVHFTIHYSAYTLQLTTTESLLFLWRSRLQLLQSTLMASLAITHYLITTCWNCTIMAVDARAIYPGNRPQRKHRLQIKVTLRPMTSRSVSLGFEPHLGLMTRCELLFDSYCLTVTVLSISGAHSDERSGLSFVLVTWTASVQYSKFSAGLRQHSLSVFITPGERVAQLYPQALGSSGTSGVPFLPLLLYDVITGTDPKKTTVPSIIALLSNGCKQAFPLLTYSVPVTLYIYTYIYQIEPKRR